ncbi:MAG: nucleotide sugar dehydrogenase [Desulfovibrio sp.]|nr:nucleotide sugar dehydrogenase [Desulfovibrio sp.]
MNIAIAGTGYVGLSLAVLLAGHNAVTAVDIIPEKIALINSRTSPIVDQEIETYLQKKDLNLTATLDAEAAYSKADFIIIATPTNYDPSSKCFDTSSIESVLRVIEAVNPEATIIIKSTVPVGFLQETRERHPSLPNILFSPEFLREGRALYDNLHPSRIIVGTPKDAVPELIEKARTFANLLLEGALEKDVPVRIVKATEAECIKLFANTYLAMRVAYFNELDTYAEQYGLDTAEIIDGVCLDPRIGAHYNNPSFGYGGYCLPKDTRQLAANFSKTPASLIPAIVEANITRKEVILKRILAKKPSTVGIYRLIMKAKSDNFRQSAIQDIIQGLRKTGIPMILYEPMLKEASFESIEVVNDLSLFSKRADLILANRITDDLRAVRSKVYTRDIYERD